MRCWLGRGRRGSELHCTATGHWAATPLSRSYYGQQNLAASAAAVTQTTDADTHLHTPPSSSHATFSAWSIALVHTQHLGLRQPAFCRLMQALIHSNVLPPAVRSACPSATDQSYAAPTPVLSTTLHVHCTSATIPVTNCSSRHVVKTVQFDRGAAIDAHLSNLHLWATDTVGK